VAGTESQNQEKKGMSMQCLWVGANIKFSFSSGVTVRKLQE
jgi:hypothetical protein